MNAFQRIQQILSGILTYGALASAAVAQVQTEVGASAGNPAVQMTKKQLAVVYVLAAAHAGETVPNAKVQEIAVMVDLAANMAKALGLFGKTAGAGSVSVPALPPPS
jgi:uracil phosphoribosyltransferase